MYALLLDLTGSATAVALMLITQYLPVAVVGPIAGVVVDRVNRRRLMITTDLLRGVLILSTFAGAAQELSDSLLVNPYDVQQVAGAILRALEMPTEEQGIRMQHLRTNVRENNVYRWAANLLSDLTDIRIDTPERVETQ